MKFETVSQAAERLGVTVRAVQKWAKEGKIEGAKKIGRDWMIPFDAAQADIDVESDDVKGVIYPLFQVPRTSGDVLKKANAIDDIDKRNLALAQIYYFMGDLDKTIELTEPYLISDNIDDRLEAALFYAFSNLCGDHIHKTRFAAELIYDEIDKLDLNDETQATQNAIKIFTAVVVKTQLHIPFNNVPLIEAHIKYLPEGLRLMACYLSAYKAYLAKDYERSVGIAQTALNCTMKSYPISEMYCHIICAIDYINLLKTDEANNCIQKAWEIGHEYKVFMPFVEHYSLFQGLLESNFKRSHPTDYNSILSLARRYNTGWFTTYNARNEGNVTYELTPTEFTIAMLYSRGWRAKEIAAHIHISERTVSNYIQIIYEKLNINGRKELENYLLK